MIWHPELGDKADLREQFPGIAGLARKVLRASGYEARSGAQ